jgi:rsbT co-antagonist protein RsbR
MWHTLNLRARLLAGYGLVMTLSGALALFLTLQLGGLNRQIAQINASSAAEAEAGSQVALLIGEMRLAVDHYVHEPGPETRDEAEHAFAAVDEALLAMQRVLGDDAAREHHDAITRQLGVYRATWQRLIGLLDEQDRLSDQVNRQVFEAGVLAGHELVGEFVVQRGGLAGIGELSEAQQSLQLAGLLLGRAISDQDQPSAERALAQLQRAQGLLARNAARPAPSTGLLEALDEATAAVETTRRLSANIALVEAVHDRQLTQQAIELTRRTGAMAADEMEALTEATTTLEQQVLRSQQLAALALLATIIAAGLVGVRLARSIARPLVELAAAVTRVNSGDYGAVVEQRAGGEIGQLATAFNQMTSTLRGQHEQVEAQQRATEARNAELERALGQLQAATAARDALAGAVRAMSVPVVPLVRHVVAVPLVGEVDAERATVLLERVLAGITDERARIVILDITGVPFVDADVAGWLLKTAAAAELLGARCVLTGISPEVAQALVASGAELGRLVTRADLRAGVEYALGALR